MDKAREGLWHENWSEARKAREQRRAENRANWANSPLNAANRHKDTYGATAPEIASEANGGGGSRSLAALRTIMADPNTPLHRRLDAAEVVLAFELGPGAAVGVDIDQIAAGSYLFLNTVIGTPGVPEALRFRALRLVASVENARAASKNTVAEHEAKRRLLINLANSRRIAALRKAGTWARVVESNEPWALEAGDTIDWPNSQWPGTWPWPPASFAAELEHADPERIAAFKQELLNIRTTNRVDRFDEILARVPAKA
jgi:hypothetical protein